MIDEARLISGTKAVVDVDRRNAARARAEHSQQSRKLVSYTHLSSAFDNVKLEDALDFSYDRWWPISSYQTYGCIPVFTATAQNLEIKQPDNYSDIEAQNIQAQLAAQYDAGRGSSPERQAAIAQYLSLIHI